MNAFKNLFFAGFASIYVVMLTPTSSLGQVTAYDNFGPGFSFNTGQGSGISGPSSSSGIESLGYLFTPSASGNLFDIRIAISRISGTNNAHLFLREASNLPSSSPGAPLTNPILESWTLTNLPSFGTNFVPQILASVSNPFLDASKSYFLYGAETGNQNNIWNTNTTNDFAPPIASFDNENYIAFPDLNSPPNLQKKGAFQVRVQSSFAPTVTPELPGFVQIVPALIPFVLVMNKRRRNKKLA